MKSRNPYNLLQLSLLDFSLMVPEKLAVVDRIHPQSINLGYGCGEKGYSLLKA